MGALPSSPRWRAAACISSNKASHADAKGELNGAELNICLRTVIGPGNDPRLARLLGLIEDDPASAIGDCALKFSLSHSHLQRLFKQATGMRLGQFITEQRLQKAAHLLTATNMSIKEIACATGYEHTSSFTRAFVRRFEQGPRRYRMESALREMSAERKAG